MNIDKNVKNSEKIQAFLQPDLLNIKKLYIQTALDWLLQTMILSYWYFDKSVSP